MGYHSSMRMRFTCPAKASKKTTKKGQVAFVKKVVDRYKQELIKKTVGDYELNWSAAYFACTLDYAVDNTVTFGEGENAKYQGSYRAEVDVNNYYVQIDWGGKFYDDTFLRILMGIITDLGGSYSYVRIGEEAGDIESLDGGPDSGIIEVCYQTNTEFVD